MEFITKEALQDLYQGHEKIEIIDLRPENFYRSNHLPNARNICVHESAFLNNVCAGIADKNTRLVIYGPCEDSQESARGFALLTAGGFKNIEILQGGFAAWTSKPTKVQDLQIESELEKTYQLNLETSRIQWLGRNIANNHTGYLRFTEGTFVVKDSKICSAHLKVDMNTLTCEDLKDPLLNGMLLKHLKSDDFFAADRYPFAEINLIEAKTIEVTDKSEENISLALRISIRDKTLSAKSLGILYLSSTSLNLQGDFAFDRTLFGSLYGSRKFFKSLAKHVVNDVVELHFTLNAS